MLAAVLLMVVSLAAPAAAEPQVGMGGPEARWAELLDAHPSLMAARAEAEAMLAAAGRRAADAGHDVRWVEGALMQSEEVLAAAVVERDDAAARRDDARRALARARRQFEEYRLRIDDHAATIYKHGPPALGPIESLLRSDSPGDFVMRQRMSEKVLIEDDAALRRAAVVLDRAEATHRRAVSDAEAARARWASVRDDTDGLRDLVSELDDQRISAVRAVAGRHRERSNALSAETQSMQAMVAVEGQITATDPDRARSLVERRTAAVDGATAELEEAYPYLGRPPDPRPKTLPSVGGYACPVEGGRFINDWAFPRPGGRSHEGTDVFADRGAAVSAVAAGEIVDVDRYDTHDVGALGGDLGGITVAILTDQGERWYYAHLATVADGIEVGVAVESGQQIGTNGDSGNARGGAAHLHLGRYWHDIAVNPYPSLALACD